MNKPPRYAGVSNFTVAVLNGISATGTGEIDASDIILF
jgi:hypothetical protein